MESFERDPDGESIGNWQAIVRTLWTLSYVGGGLRYVLPRLVDLPQSIRALSPVLATVEKETTLQALEGELKEMSQRFDEVLTSLRRGRRQMQSLLKQVEECRTSLAGSADE